jgi:transmembrane sensor
MNPNPPSPSDSAAAEAAVWLARRDRGLTAAEQDGYLEWLQADPLHGQAMKQQERVWNVLDHLEQWRPAHSTAPNPDLLAPGRSRRPYWLLASGLAMAAALMMLVTLSRPVAVKNVDPTPRREAIVHPGPERRILADGSMVELNRDAKIEVIYTAGERRVKLVHGEAYFTVAKNPDRPFIVEASGVAVRAIGTAFSVALGRSDVSVLVTQGSVQVLDNDRLKTPDAAPVVLAAGQRTVIRLIKLRPANRVATVPPPPQVQDVTPAEVDQALSWQGMRLEFVEMPLSDVVGSFNRYNRRKLRLSDDEIAGLLVGGNFRADNVDAFVRLLDSGFGIAAVPQGDEIVLQRAR